MTLATKDEGMGGRGREGFKAPSPHPSNGTNNSPRHIPKPSHGWGVGGGRGGGGTQPYIGVALYLPTFGDNH